MIVALNEIMDKEIPLEVKSLKQALSNISSKDNLEDVKYISEKTNLDNITGKIKRQYLSILIWIEE